MKTRSGCLILKDNQHTIKVGPAGAGGLGYPGCLRKLTRMKLDCMEVEFTYGVRMTMETAKEFGALAKEKGITLSVHAPYYINLASDDPEKAAASRKRILDSCRRAHALGARNVAFHAGFYQNKTPGLTYRIIREAVADMQGVISDRGWDVTLCPEITGKPSQFGSLKELLTLMEDTGCGITVDFAHLYARHQGEINYDDILARLPPRFHAHFSGIQYGPKGEKKHIGTTKKFFEPLAKALLKRQPDVTIINESTRPYKDAAMMKRELQKLQKVDGVTSCG